MTDQEKADRSAHIERTLRKCALELDPSGQLQILAAAMGCTPKVFRYWMNRGRVPKVKATWLQSRFGKEIADASTLTA